MLSRRRRLGQKGISNVELIPVLLVFALLFNFALGFFGVIHSGILNSIAARNYAFETFRNRANLTYLRDIPGVSMGSRYTKDYFRFHGIITEGRSSDAETEWVVTRRPIRFTDVNSGIEEQGEINDHRQLVRQIADTGKASDIFSGRTPEEGRSGVSPVWLQTLYGICLNSKCGK